MLFESFPNVILGCCVVDGIADVNRVFEDFIASERGVFSFWYVVLERPSDVWERLAPYFRVTLAVVGFFDWSEREIFSVSRTNSKFFLTSGALFSASARVPESAELFFVYHPVEKIRKNIREKSWCKNLSSVQLGWESFNDAI